MRRSLFVLAVGGFSGSAVTLALGFWVQGGLQNAVALGNGRNVRRAVSSGNGDVNGDGVINQRDAVYLIKFIHADGPAPVPIMCPPCDSCCPPAPPCRLAATGQTTCYDSAGAEIPCDSADYPGQDAFYKAACPTEGRFVENGDGTVTDTCTALMWQKETADTSGNGSIGDEDRLDWQSALQYCDSLSFAGHDDWRLPNVLELHSIVDHGRWGPAIDPVFGSLSVYYRSSTSVATGPLSAWTIDFNGGGVRGINDKGSPVHVRAVRNAE